MDAIQTFVAIYSVILLVLFIFFVVKLRKVKREGDERQIALFYRSSFDGMLGGIFGYLLAVIIKLFKMKLGVPEVYFAWVPSPIVIAVLTMYIGYQIRSRIE
jgi:hypothetical protein